MPNEGALIDAVVVGAGQAGLGVSRKRPFEARLPAMWVNVLGQSGAAGFRVTLWIALRTTRRVSVIGGSKF
ncbi:hypothetical protein [Siccirubricoccus sp. G192]|uniref:hypothetical protein n=1 Tax=Siccirubricoccus sp. G192 TaxID=2849651 RepID=UPI001C2BED75|nr:hypothetical protein [Siccirubricoccus sp. G192]MBV1796467.1 hypothetical protein [Siccirubricoccus sp. G192]